MKRIVIIGAGIAAQGIIAKLAKKSRYHITVICNIDYISNKPLYPDVAGGCLDPKCIKYSLQSFAEKHHIDHIVTSVRTIDFSSKTIQCQEQEITYDYLIIATGTETNFYDHPEYKECVHTIDSFSAVLALRNDLHAHLKDTQKPLELVVIGGGYTGIEYISHVINTCKKHKKEYSITIIEVADDILGPLPTNIKTRVRIYLEKRNVDIRTNQTIKTLSRNMVELGSDSIHADIIVWTAGMRGVDLNASLGVENKGARILVDNTTRIPHEACVFVAGDAAFGYRLAVPFAKQYATYIVKTITAIEENKPIPAFNPTDYGFVIALAEWQGIGTIMGFPMRSLYGYIFHYFMSMLSLLGAHNKIKLLESLF